MHQNSKDSDMTKLQEAREALDAARNAVREAERSFAIVKQNFIAVRASTDEREPCNCNSDCPGDTCKQIACEGHSDWCNYYSLHGGKGHFGP